MNNYINILNYLIFIKCLNNYISNFAVHCYFFGPQKVSHHLKELLTFSKWQFIHTKILLIVFLFALQYCLYLISMFDFAIELYMHFK